MCAADGTVLGVALLTVVVVGALAGVGPALQSGRVGLDRALREGGRGGVGRGGLRVVDGIAAAEMALAVMLLVSWLLLREPDFGALVVIAMIAFSILFLGGMNGQHFAALLGMLAAGFALLVVVPFYVLRRRRDRERWAALRLADARRPPADEADAPWAAALAPEAPVAVAADDADDGASSAAGSRVSTRDG